SRLEKTHYYALPAGSPWLLQLSRARRINAPQRLRLRHMRPVQSRADCSANHECQRSSLNHPIFCQFAGDCLDSVVQQVTHISHAETRPLADLLVREIFVEF